MAEATQYHFSHQELVTALIKAQGIHEGIWSLSVEFGFGAGNAGPNDKELLPTGMISIQRMGLTRVTVLSNMAVDAAEVNPKPTKSKKAA